MNSKQMLRETVESEPWGPAFLREMELTIAANVLASNHDRSTLYNDTLNRRVAERCRDLDGAYRERFLGVIRVAPNPEAWRRGDAELAELASNPRGTWAILEKDGGHGVYMSNGLGGCDSPSGHEYTYTTPLAPDLTADTGYASCLSYMVYKERRSIEHRLDEERLDRIEIAPGSVFRDVYMSGKTWNRVTFLEERTNAQGRRVLLLERARRGVKTQLVEIERSFKQTLSPALYELPADLVDGGSDARMTTMAERRAAAAQDAYERLSGRIAERSELSPFASKGPFRRDGEDRVVRATYRGDHPHVSQTGTVAVTFVPGTDQVSSSIWTPVEGPALAA